MLNLKILSSRQNKIFIKYCIIGVLSILATSANAGYWSHTPQIGGGWKSTYMPSTTDILRQHGLW